MTLARQRRNVGAHTRGRASSARATASVLLDSQGPSGEHQPDGFDTPTASSLLDPRATPPPAGEGRTQPSPAPRSRPLSLLSLVFLTNGSVLVIALLLLAFSPIEIDAPIKTGQFALLLAGFVVRVGLNLLMLRRFRTLLQLTEAMSSVDPDRPGRRSLRSDTGLPKRSRSGLSTFDRRVHARTVPSAPSRRRVGHLVRARPPLRTAGILGSVLR
jgi:hypothetical protein